MQESKQEQVEETGAITAQRKGVALEKKSLSKNDGVVQRYWIERDNGDVEWTGKTDAPPILALFNKTGNKRYKYDYLPKFLNTELDIWKRKPLVADVGRGGSQKKRQSAPKRYNEPDQAGPSSFTYESSERASRVRPVRSNEALGVLLGADLDERSSGDDLFRALVAEFGEDRVDLSFPNVRSIRSLFAVDESEDEQDDGDDGKVNPLYGQNWDINDVNGIGNLNARDRAIVQLRVDEANNGRVGAYRGHRGVGNMWTMDVTGTDQFGGGGRGNARLQFNPNGAMTIVGHDGGNLL